MIEVESLSKAYGATLAIDGLSFVIEPGELVGFLGKNGAGKTTTMRILTGALGASQGTAKIGGLDVEQHPRQVKAMVGYLPEVPPLYVDMTVRAYLRYAARLKGVDNPKPAVETVIQRVGLAEVAHRLIGHLSKGFKQRVGIAQAIVHSPKVLILDEPLSGLDPAQRREIRDVVAELARGETTVLLSTHVLPEIEAICDRVIVLDQGRVVAQERIADLAARGGRVGLVLGRPQSAALDVLRNIDGVVELVDQGQGKLDLTLSHDVRAEIARVAVAFDLLELRSLDNLEDAFLRLTSTPDSERP
ncbi:MAG: ABC transporter ATP-binding protein [Deltaproteobacteria bacterium]|nr:MAG: ABC transporter ATP-binding protein [Deltaproteobacteria bacterium]